MIENPNEVSNEELAEYVGRNKLKYLYNFAKFQQKGERFCLTWHWPAFFFGPIWFLYRKLYFWALIAVLLCLLPVGNVIAQFAYSACAYYIYYRDSKKKIAKIKAVNPQHNTMCAIKEAGGVHRWILWVSILLILLSPIAGFYYADNISKNIKVYRQEIIIKKENSTVPGQQI